MKFSVQIGVQIKTRSPSMRREWIEISNSFRLTIYRSVSLHAEGVD